MQVGDDVVLRYITRDGRPGMTWAARLIEDRSDLVALYLPRDTAHRRWRRGPDGPELAPAAWWADTLRLMPSGRSHSVWLSWGPDGRFIGYYVNLEEPFRRTTIGFDTNDHTLDIVVTPDRKWSWKDEDALRAQEREGSYSSALIEAIRREAQNVIDTIESGRGPFDGAWDGRRAEPEWPTPVLRPEWDREPAALWDRRAWAYPHRDDPRRSESG